MNYVEQDCTISHEGIEYTSGGAFVSDSYIVAYPGKNGVLTDWHGKAIGSWYEISSRPAIFFGRQSWVGSTYYYMRANVDGKLYSLRGFGIGMSATGKRIKDG